MNILALCSTSYQILVLNQIVYQYYPNEKIYVIITDTFSDAEHVYSNMLKENKFAHVEFWHTKGKLQYSKIQMVVVNCLGWIFSKNVLRKYTRMNIAFDCFLFANNSPIAMHIANVLRHNNKKLNMGFFEDGASTYSTYIGKVFDKRNLRTWLVEKAMFHVNDLYVFNPNLLEWKPNCRINIVNTISKGETLDLDNRIFSYDELKDVYLTKYIFFEEAYYADGKNIDDVQFVNKIASIVGKDNIFVKIHPRNLTNRFAELGYKTNRNVFIPWELIVANEEMIETVFITIASNAALTPFLVFNKNNKVIMLYNFFKDSGAIYPKIVAHNNELHLRYPDIFYAPKDEEELKDLLREL